MGVLRGIQQQTGSIGASVLSTVLSIISVKETFPGGRNLIHRMRKGFRFEPLEGRNYAVFDAVPAQGIVGLNRSTMEQIDEVHHRQ
jgi:hypothetical protein